MNVYDFMNQSPVLTFFLALFILGTITSVFKCLAVMVRGWRPRKNRTPLDLALKPPKPGAIHYNGCTNLPGCGCNLCCIRRQNETGSPL